MTQDKRRGGALYQAILGGIVLLFIGIMVYVYHGAKQANPIILDEHGHPRDAAAQSSH
jgi:hypothetical protein